MIQTNIHSDKLPFDIPGYPGDKFPLEIYLRDKFPLDIHPGDKFPFTMIKKNVNWPMAMRSMENVSMGKSK